MQKNECFIDKYIIKQIQFLLDILHEDHCGQVRTTADRHGQGSPVGRTDGRRTHGHHYDAHL